MTPVLTGSDLLEDREFVCFVFSIFALFFSLLVPKILHIIQYLVIICRMGEGWMDGGRVDGWMNEWMDGE